MWCFHREAKRTCTDASLNAPNRPAALCNTICDALSLGSDWLSAQKGKLLENIVQRRGSSIFHHSVSYCCTGRRCCSRAERETKWCGKKTEKWNYSVINSQITVGTSSMRQSLVRVSVLTTDLLLSWWPETSQQPSDGWILYISGPYARFRAVRCFSSPITIQPQLYFLISLISQCKHANTLS